MLSCREVTELASRELDGPLPSCQRWGVRLHLIYCRLCRHYVRSLPFLERVLGAAGEERVAPYRNGTAGLSNEARARIRLVLQERND